MEFSRHLCNPPDEESDVHLYVLLDRKIRRVKVEKKQYANKLTGAVFSTSATARVLTDHITFYQLDRSFNNHADYVQPL